jgi:hypothetical protein
MDIVERLRSGCTCNFESTPCGAEEECQNAFDGADEIERLREALREIYEVYAGSEGIPQPMTAAEGYLLSLLMEAVEIASKALCGREQGPRLDDRGSNLDGN